MRKLVAITLFLSPKQTVTLFDYKIADEIIYLSSINSIQIEEKEEEKAESKEQSNSNNLIHSNLIDELIVTLIDFYQSVNKTEIIFDIEQINSSNSFSLSIDTNKFILPAYTSLNSLILKFKNIWSRIQPKITTLKYVQFSTISYLINFLYYLIIIVIIYYRFQITILKRILLFLLPT